MSLTRDEFNSIKASLGREGGGIGNDYYLTDYGDKSERKAGDLENLTVPEFGSEITLTAMFDTGPDETFEAANGVAFTVRELFDIIGKYEATQREGCGPSDRVFFEGLEEKTRKPGCYNVFWGS